jgi:alkylation response protein AidB-like acyl-CoA dehydrogenase
LSHYISNLRDIEFNLFEVFGAGERLGSQYFPDIDVDTARAMLIEVNRLAVGSIAESFASSDRNPPVYDPTSKTVTMPESFKKTYETYMESGWWRLNLPHDLGGVGAPPSLRWAANELLLGSNPCLINLTSGITTLISVLALVGNQEQRRWAELMTEKHWGGVVALTEPDAGSDVGAGLTKAIDNGDGTWRIEGVKRFITSGEHDLADNIVHLVLARPEGAKPGTKGLSMFLVPKFFVNMATGEVEGRNGVYATRLEKKLGLRCSPTCEMTYGADAPAIGWLVGDVHDGIAQIFKVMEFARMSVGTKAVAALSSGYLNALDYARSRVQGSDLVDMSDKAAPRVTIMHHPDIRRSLLQLKAYSEGLRALLSYAAYWQDLVSVGSAGDPSNELVLAQRMNDFLLPIVKGVGSERSYELLASALQTYGGSGFLQDYPIEQYIRDTKIDTIYEGTTAIQAMDLFFRKMAHDNFVAFNFLTAEIDDFVRCDDELSSERAILGTALTDVRGIVRLLVDWYNASHDSPDEIYKVGLNATRLLMATGDLIIGWLLLRQAEIAVAALRAGSKEADFYRGKVEGAKWFAHNRLPLLRAELSVADATDLDIMRISEAAF